MVWMFFGLLPASAGELFDGEHVRCVSDGCTRWVGAAALGEIVRIFLGSRKDPVMDAGNRGRGYG